jgi:hypothetical protein
MLNPDWVSALEVVGPRATVDGVDAAPAHQEVVEPAAVDRVVAPDAEDLLLVRPAVQDVPGGRARAGDGADRTEEGVGATEAVPARRGAAARRATGAVQERQLDRPGSGACCSSALPTRRSPW